MGAARRAAACASLALAAAAPLQAQHLRPTQPLDRLEQRARADSLDPVAFYNLALGYMDKDRWDDADSALRRAAALDPRFAPAQLALSVVQDRHREYWRALRNAGGDSAVAAERRRREAAGRRAYLLDPFVGMQILCYSERFSDHERESLARGDFWLLFVFASRARSVLLARMATPVEDSLPPGLLWVRAIVAGQLERDSDAIADLNVLLRVMEHREVHDDSLLPIPMLTTEIRYMLAALHQRRGERLTAMSIYGEVAGADLGNFMAHVQLARLHEAGEEWSQAVQERRRAIAIDPEDPTLVRDLGVTLLRARRAAEAESVLTDESTANPRDWNALYHLGMAREALGHYPAAIAAYDAFIARAPQRLTAAIGDARQRADALRRKTPAN